MSEDIVAFLTSRLAEDEAVARAAVRSGRELEWFDHLDEVWTATDLTDPRRCTEHPAGVPNACDDDRVASANDDADELTEARAEHIARHDPARVLREVSAKRAILARHTKSVGDDGYADFCDECDGEFPCGTLRALVTAYSDHPNYRAEWTIGA